MKLSEIQIGERVRKDMGDIEALAESIQRHGLLHPIVVKSNGMLIAGHRRLEAARALGWDEIPVTVIEVEDLLMAERDENVERKDFTPTEAVAIGALIEEQHRIKIEAQRHDLAVAAGVRSAQARGATVLETTKRGNPAAPPNGTLVAAGHSDKAAASAVGMSKSSYHRAKQIVQAAADNPETFGDLPTQMDEGVSINAVHTEMERRKGANGKAHRHPVFKKMHFIDANKAVEKATWALDGICDSLKSLSLDELDPTRAKAWALSLKKSAATISQLAKKVANVKA